MSEAMRPTLEPTPRSTTEAVFLDLDGCLVDSRDAITHCINHGLTAVGLTARAPADLYRFIGPPLIHTFEELLSAGGADPALAATCIDRYRERYTEVAAELTTLVPGIAAAVAAISERATVAVVTSKPTAFAAPLVTSVGLDRWVEHVFGPELDEHIEPKATTLRRALAWAGIAEPPGARVWMVGDRHHDVEAGRTCGTATVGVTWGIGDRAELAAARADVIVDDPGELAGVVLA